MYIQPLGPAIHPQDLQFHAYAEDTQLLVPGLISGHHQAHTAVDSVEAGCLPTKNKDHEPEVIPPASANKLSAILYCFCFLWSFFFFSPAYWESWCLSLMHQSHESDINAVCKPTLSFVRSVTFDPSCQFSPRKSSHLLMYCPLDYCYSLLFNLPNNLFVIMM